MQTQRHGFTLLESLVVTAVIAFAFVTITSLYVRSTQVYWHAAGHIEPQTSQALALKRMEREIRQAYLIEGSQARANSLVIYMPAKTEDDLVETVLFNDETEDAANNHTDDNLIGVVLGDKITYATVRETASEGGIDLDGNGSIDTFKLIRKVRTPAGVVTTDPQPIITGITTRVAAEEDPDEYKRVYLFEFWPLDNMGTPNNLEDDEVTNGNNKARLAKVSLASPYIDKTPHGPVRKYHVLSTMFHLRNLSIASKN